MKRRGRAHGKPVAPSGQRSLTAAGKAAGPRSFIWVEADDPARRIVPHDVTLGVALGRGTAGAVGATLDLFAERGGKEFAGLTVQSLRVPGVRDAAELIGLELVDPPPRLVGIASLGGPGTAGPGEAPAHARTPSPLRKLGLAVDEDMKPAPDAGPGADLAGRRFDEDEDEAAPDDDPELGDIESYRRRRAEEAKVEPAPDDPELDDGALAEAEAAAAAERVLIAPGQAYEIESIKLTIRAIRDARAEIHVEGRCAQIDERGEIERSGVPFGGRLFATLEVFED